MSKHRFRAPCVRDQGTKHSKIHVQSATASQSLQGRKGVPVGDCDYAVGTEKAGLHYIHVFPPDGVIQPEVLDVMRGDFQGAELRHGTPTLMGHVVDDKHTPRECHLVVFPVMRLQDAKFAGLGPKKRCQNFHFHLFICFICFYLFIYLLACLFVCFYLFIYF
jgi:hypothetical protein